MGLIPGWETKIPHDMQDAKKKKKFLNGVFLSYL